METNQEQQTEATISNGANALLAEPRSVSPSLHLSHFPSLSSSPALLLIAGGGTGGHIYPGVAIAQEFMRRNVGNRVVFVGTAKGLETKIVPRAGFELRLLKVAALKRVSVVQRIKSLALLPKSFLDVAALLRELRPAVVIGVGGYSSGPVLLIAALLGFPTLIVEPNALPGFTNRVLARFVRAAAVTFEEARGYFGKKAVVTGNPVRAEFFQVPEKQFDAKQAGKRFQVLVTGGSQGARAINEAFIAALPLLEEALRAAGKQMTILHQTGEADCQKVQAAYAQLPAVATSASAAPLHVTAQPFLENMVDAFAQADLVVTRAGATIVAELAAAGKPALLIPFPFAADDHQRKNAEAVANAGAGRMILQAELTPQRLRDELVTLCKDPARLRQMSHASRQLAQQDAAAKVVDLALALNR